MLKGGCEGTLLGSPSLVGRSCCFYIIVPIFELSGELDVPGSAPLLYLLAVAVVIILFIILLGVIMAKRKRKHGFLWLPEGFTLRRDSSNHKRREPVGQDAVGLK